MVVQRVTRVVRSLEMVETVDQRQVLMDHAVLVAWVAQMVLAQPEVQAEQVQFLVWQGMLLVVELVEQPWATKVLAAAAVAMELQQQLVNMDRAVATRVQVDLVAVDLVVLVGVVERKNVFLAAAVAAAVTLAVAAEPQPLVVLVVVPAVVVVEAILLLPQRPM